MGNSATRRHQRHRHEAPVTRHRGMRTLAILAAVSIAGSLTLGSASVAMADEGVSDTTVATTQVNAPATDSKAQGDTGKADDIKTVPDAPAPKPGASSDQTAPKPAVTPKDTPSKEVKETKDVVVSDPVSSQQQDAPAEVVKDVPPIAVPAEGKSTPVSPTPPIKKGVDTSNDPVVGGGGQYHVLKLFVCKYVGTPGVDERLQTGQNPISVSVNALQQDQWTGAVPGWFSDAHDRSYALAFDEGQPEPSVSECPLVDAPDVPEVPSCVQIPSWSYTFDGVGSGVVTVSAAGAKQGDALCDALAVRATTYEYDRPASGNPSWPQTLVGYNDVTVDSIGTFSYAAPALDVCRQHDIYAEFESHGGFSALAVPEKLNGSNDPYEPPFLHQTLSGKGPNPTYSTTTSEGCNTPSEPEVVTGTGTFETLSCTEGSRNWAELDAVPGGVWTFTDKNGGTYKTATGEGFSGTVPGGLAYGDIVVSLDDTEDTMNGPSGYDVTPWSGTWTTVDPESLDCNVDTDEPEVVTGTATFQTLSCTEGSKNWADTDTVSGGKWVFTDKNGEEFTTAVGKSYEGGIPDGLAYGDIVVTLDDADESDNYDVTPWSGTWKTVDPASLDCNVDTDEPVVVTGTATFETLSCTEGSKNWATTDTVKGGVWIFLDNKNGERYVTESGKAYTGGIPEGLAYGTINVELRDGDSTDNYDVTPWDGTWTTVNPDSLDCDTDTPPTDNPPANNPPGNNPPGNNPPAQNPPANNPPQAFVPATDSLAYTGADVSGLAIMAGLLVLAGLATMVFTHRRRVAGQL